MTQPLYYGLFPLYKSTTSCTTSLMVVSVLTLTVVWILLPISFQLLTGNDSLMDTCLIPAPADVLSNFWRNGSIVRVAEREGISLERLTCLTGTRETVTVRSKARETNKRSVACITPLLRKATIRTLHLPKFRARLATPFVPSF